MDLTPWVPPSVTFLAILAALFKEDIVRKWRKPKLRIAVNLTPPDSEYKQMYLKTMDGGQERVIASADCYTFRIRIENMSKTQPAERVQVYATEIGKMNASGTYQWIDTFLPINLQWTNSMTPDPDAFAEIINPGMFRYCDLGHIIEPKMNEMFGHVRQGIDSSKATFAFFNSFPSQSKSELLGMGKYQLKILLSASNAPPKTVLIELSVTGEWSDDMRRMLSDGVGIRVKG